MSTSTLPAPSTPPLAEDRVADERRQRAGVEPAALARVRRRVARARGARHTSHEHRDARERNHHDGQPAPRACVPIRANCRLTGDDDLFHDPIPPVALDARAGPVGKSNPGASGGSPRADASRATSPRTDSTAPRGAGPELHARRPRRPRQITLRGVLDTCGRSPGTPATGTRCQPRESVSRKRDDAALRDRSSASRFGQVPVTRSSSTGACVTGATQPAGRVPSRTPGGISPRGSDAPPGHHAERIAAATRRGPARRARAPEPRTREDAIPGPGFAPAPALGGGWTGRSRGMR